MFSLKSAREFAGQRRTKARSLLIKYDIPQQNLNRQQTLARQLEVLEQEPESEPNQ